MGVIAMTGASGFLGRALAPRLRAAGHTVVPVPRELGLLPEADALIHLAGESPAGPWTVRKRDAILRSRVEGTQRLIRRLRDVRRLPRVLLSASGAGYYGDRPGERLDEDSLPGRGFRSEVCVAWEAEARRAESLGIRTVLLRFGSVLDPSGGYLGKMLPFLRRGLCFVLGGESDPFAWIALEDALRLVERALADPALRGPVNVVAPLPATQGEFARAAASIAGRRVLARLPRPGLRLLLGEFSRALTDSQDVRPRAALERGFAFRHPDLGSWALASA